MEIKILSIGDKGILDSERIGFMVLKSCQLKFYIVIKTKIYTSGFGNISDGAYWFLPQEVLENDQIVLYTKKGNNSIKENADGTKIYFFYWGLENPIFEQDNSKIVLVNANAWIINE